MLHDFNNTSTNILLLLIKNGKIYIELPIIESHFLSFTLFNKLLKKVILINSVSKNHRAPTLCPNIILKII